MCIWYDNAYKIIKNDIVYDIQVIYDIIMIYDIIYDIICIMTNNCIVS